MEVRPKYLKYQVFCGRWQSCRPHVRDAGIVSTSLAHCPCNQAIIANARYLWGPLAARKIVDNMTVLALAGCRSLTGEVGDTDAGLPDDSGLLKELESEFQTLQSIRQPVDWAQLDKSAAAPIAHALPEPAAVGTPKRAAGEACAQEVRPPLKITNVRSRLQQLPCIWTWIRS